MNFFPNKFLQLPSACKSQTVPSETFKLIRTNNKSPLRDNIKKPINSPITNRTNATATTAHSSNHLNSKSEEKLEKFIDLNLNGKKSYIRSDVSDRKTERSIETVDRNLKKSGYHQCNCKELISKLRSQIEELTKHESQLVQKVFNLEMENSNLIKELEKMEKEKKSNSNLQKQLNEPKIIVTPEKGSEHRFTVFDRNINKNNYFQPYHENGNAQPYLDNPNNTKKKLISSFENEKNASNKFEEEILLLEALDKKLKEIEIVSNEIVKNKTDRNFNQNLDVNSDRTTNNCNYNQSMDVNSDKFLKEFHAMYKEINKLQEKLILSEKENKILKEKMTIQDKNCNLDGGEPLPAFLRIMQIELKMQ